MQVVNFRQQIEDIFHMGFTSAIGRFGGSEQVKTPIDERLFVAAVHKGWADAQDEIIDLILRLEESWAQTRGALQEARRENKGGRASLFSRELRTIESRLAITRKLADSIAWQMIGGQHYIARRLYTGKGAGLLSETNLSHAKEYVAKKNTDPQSFALITDITSFIQVGDVLVTDRNGDGNRLNVVELKEGAMNEKVRGAIDFFEKSGCERFLHLFNRIEGEKAFEQLKRVVKQEATASQLIDILNTGSGTDPNTNEKVRISEETCVLSDYDNTLRNMLSDSTKKGWAIDLLDGCLFVGAYTKPYPGSQAFRGWITGSRVNISYPRTSLVQGLFTPLAYPLFLRGISEKSIFDLIFGHQEVFLYLDLDAYMDLARQQGLSCRWLSRSETAKHNPHGKSAGLVEIAHRGIVFDKEDRQLFLGDGILSRMFYDGITPSSTIGIIQATLEDTSSP